MAHTDHRRINAMAKDKKSKKAEETPATNNGLERVLNRTTVQPNWKAFSAFVEEAGGPKINPKHVGIVLTGYKYFQKSDSAVAAREEAAEEKAAAQAERDAAREARAKEKAAKAAEREERKAAADKASKEKAAKATKSAAAKSKPTPKASAGKATAKKAAAKKTASKNGKGAKAAF
jgi:hypothetical protein